MNRRISGGFPREKSLIPLAFLRGDDIWMSVLSVGVYSRFNHVQLYVTLWMVAHQALLSMGFSSKNTGVGFHSLLQGIFPTRDQTHISYLSCIAGVFVTRSTSLVAQTVKGLLTMWEAQVRSLGREDPLEKEMATHSSTLVWKIPWTEERARLHGVAKSWTGLSDFTFTFFSFFTTSTTWEASVKEE